MDPVTKRVFGVALLLLLAGPKTGIESKTSGPQWARTAGTGPGGYSKLCVRALEGAANVYGEVEPRLPPALKSQAEIAVRQLAPRSSVPQAWSDFGAAALMRGQTDAAIWAFFKAVADSRDTDILANLGTALLYGDYTQQGALILECVEHEGDDSPWVHEALASAYYDLGRKADAQKQITRALRLAPDNAGIRVEHALLTTGKPPKSPLCKDDVVGCAWKELNDHVDATLAELEERAAALDAMEARAGFPENARRTRRLKLLRDHFKKTLAAAEPYILAGKKDPKLFNSSLLQCAEHYAAFNKAQVEFLLEEDWLFWAAVEGLKPPAFARTVARDIEDNRKLNGEPQKVLHTMEEAVTGGATQWTWAPYVAYGRQEKQFFHFREDKREEWSKALDACGGIKSAIDAKACHAVADANYCRAVAGALTIWEQGARDGFKLAGARFDGAAYDLFLDMDSHLEDAIDYADRTLSHQKKSKLPPIRLPDGRKVDPTQMQRQAVAAQLTGILNLMDRALAARGQEYRNGLDGVKIAQNDAWSEWQRQCKGVEKKLAEALYVQENAEKLLKALQKRLADETRPTWTEEWECELEVGPFKAKVNEDTLTEQFKFLDNFITEKKQRGDSIAMVVKARAHAEGFLPGIVDEVAAGKLGLDPNELGVEAGAGVVGSVELSVYGEYNPKTGKWETYIEPKAKIGVGVKNEVFGAACYPGYFSSKINVRRMVQMEKQMHYLQQSLKAR